MLQYYTSLERPYIMHQTLFIVSSSCVLYCYLPTLASSKSFLGLKQSLRPSRL